MTTTHARNLRVILDDFRPLREHEHPADDIAAAADHIVKLEDALHRIQDFPSGWGHMPSITDFIDEVLA